MKQNKHLYYLSVSKVWPAAIMLPVAFLVAIVAPIITTLLLRYQGVSGQEMYAETAFLTIFLEAVVFVVYLMMLTWTLRFRYAIDERGLTVRYGLLWRPTYYIAFSRIKSVRQLDSALDRWFGLTGLEMSFDGYPEQLGATAIERLMTADIDTRRGLRIEYWLRGKLGITSRFIGSTLVISGLTEQAAEELTKIIHHGQRKKVDPDQLMAIEIASHRAAFTRTMALSFGLAVLIALAYVSWWLVS